MSFLQVLDDALDSAITPYHEFMLNMDRTTLHVFVEGLDDRSFYWEFIKPYFEKFDRFWLYVCNGKDQVYETRKDISERPQAPAWWNTMGIVFLVDKDLSDFGVTAPPSFADVFVTDYYSIENYFVSPDMLHTILLLFVRFDGGNKPPFLPILERFELKLSRFYDLLKPLMAWGVYHQGRCSSLSFGKLKPSKLYEVNVRENDIFVDTKYEAFNDELVHELDRTCDVSTSDSFNAEITEFIRLLEPFHPKLYVRGKYELWFMLRYVDALEKLLNADSQGRFNVKVSRGPLGQHDVVKTLASKLTIHPKGLDDFLRRNLGTHIGGE